MKTYPELKTIPVVVLTTSREQRDILDSFELGASGYMVKPVDYSKFVEILSRIVIYWSSSELPIQETLLAEIKH
jgi:DNA-binding NarL/FixJ family response regulator